MRRAFLADERPVTLSTSIRLSPREAISGATVPLDVPVRCTCGVCGGRGESWTTPCARCHGGGTELLRHSLQVTIPAGILDGARFQFTVTPRHSPSTRIELIVRLTE
jgi:DnaJ-class molecular chaperone